MADNDDALTKYNIFNLVVLTCAVLVIDSKDSSILSVCYGHMIISLLSIIIGLMGRNNSGGQSSLKYHCFYIIYLLVTLYLRFVYTVRYFKMPSEVSDKYPATLVYLRILIIINLFILLLTGLIILGVFLLCAAKCCEFCCPNSWGRTLMFQSFAVDMTNALSEVHNSEAVNFIIANIQKKKFRAAMHNDVKECPICLMEFVEGTEIIELPCDRKHCFHAACIQTWIAGQRRISCPLCRKDMAEELNKKQAEERKENAGENNNVNNNEICIEMGST